MADVNVTTAFADLDNTLNEMAILFSSIKHAGLHIVDQAGHDDAWLGEAVKSMAETGERAAEQGLEIKRRLAKCGELAERTLHKNA